ncbi:hypothetical protein HanIR_Chr16g0837721 [Helianthus annuus]|nr:hypothetical protein HanIR_Chr16g0837721 [Helianthus annuus]
MEPLSNADWSIGRSVEDRSIEPCEEIAQHPTRIRVLREGTIIQGVSRYYLPGSSVKGEFVNTEKINT